MNGYFGVHLRDVYTKMRIYFEIGICDYALMFYDIFPSMNQVPNATVL